MAAVKKKVKHTYTNKNVYLPHKIRSHPFYFIWLPLRVTILFVFFWIVLVPVLYIILSSRVPGFGAFSLYYFVGMFVLFLIALSIFACQWRCKNSRQSNIYYIEYETVEPREMVEIKKKPIVREVENKKLDVEKEAPTVEIEKESHRSVVHHQLKEKTVIVTEERRIVKRPVTLLLEKEPRPSSQNLNSPLSPRELFFLDMYEYANKAMRNATDNFIQRERLFYDQSGPVQREYSDNLSDTSEIQQIEQHTADESLTEQYPVEEPDLLHKKSSLSEQSPITKPYLQYKEPPVTEQTPIREPYLLHEKSPVSELAPWHSRLSKIIQENSEICEPTIVPVKRKPKMKKPTEREYFIANIVPQEHWTTEAYLFVEEKEKPKKPYTIVVDMDESV